jgi:hypothetical protein
MKYVTVEYIFNATESQIWRLIFGHMPPALWVWEV